MATIKVALPTGTWVNVGTDSMFIGNVDTGLELISSVVSPIGTPDGVMTMTGGAFSVLPRVVDAWYVRSLLKDTSFTYTPLP